MKRFVTIVLTLLILSACLFTVSASAPTATADPMVQYGFGFENTARTEYKEAALSQAIIDHQENGGANDTLYVKLKENVLLSKQIVFPEKTVLELNNFTLSGIHELDVMLVFRKNAMIRSGTLGFGGNDCAFICSDAALSMGSVKMISHDRNGALITVVGEASLIDCTVTAWADSDIVAVRNGFENPNRVATEAITLTNCTMNLSAPSTSAAVTHGSIIVQDGSYTADGTGKSNTKHLALFFAAEGASFGGNVQIEAARAYLFFHAQALSLNGGGVPYTGTPITVYTYDPLRSDFNIATDVTRENKDKVKLVIDSEYNQHFELYFDESQKVIRPLGGNATITWYDEDGSVLADPSLPTTAKIGDVIVPPAEYSKDGKVFCGWVVRDSVTSEWSHYITKTNFTVTSKSLEVKPVYAVEIEPIQKDSRYVYPIYTVNDLLNMGLINEFQIQWFPQGEPPEFLLMNDLDLAEVCGKDKGGLRPLSASTPFRYTFNGNGHTIRNLYLDNPLDGFFHSLGDGATVCNLTLTGTSHSGSFLTYSFSNEAKIRNCTFIGTMYTYEKNVMVRHQYPNMGVVGNDHKANLSNCTVDIAILPYVHAAQGNTNLPTSTTTTNTSATTTAQKNTTITTNVTATTNTIATALTSTVEVSNTTVAATQTTVVSDITTATAATSAEPNPKNNTWLIFGWVFGGVLVVILAGGLFLYFHKKKV